MSKLVKIYLLVAIIVLYFLFVWKRSQNVTIIIGYYYYYIHEERTPIIPDHALSLDGLNCKIIDDDQKFDCHPDPGASEERCIHRGCCWSEKHHNEKIPSCYFPYNYSSYVVTEHNNKSWGIQLSLQRSSPSPWPKDIFELKVDIIFERQDTIHVKIYDASSDRYEVPIRLPSSSIHSADSHMDIIIQDNPFGVQIVRKDTKAVLFDSTLLEAPLIFADQFIQMSSKLPSKYLYGIGESTGPFLHNLSEWKQITLWAHDGVPHAGNNLYGSHPFFLSFDENRRAFGLYIHNSNAGEYVLQPFPAVTYRTIGGILDFYLFSGPSPDDVVHQYTEYIGKQFLVPYWSLGFHLCRFGIHNDTHLRDIIKRNLAIQIPYDTQWMDIDYLDGYRDWALSNKFSSLPEIIDELHNASMHFMMIVDPAIDVSHAGHYKPYDDAIKSDVFIKDDNDNVLIGKVWPGATAFPDFSNPNAESWWTEQASQFHRNISFDGLWIDMNEPSNFVYGSVSGCPKNDFNYPPYSPHVYPGGIISKTVCPSAKQHFSRHYDLHNLYGHMEANATFHALKSILGNQRSIVITRSSFAGTGQFSGHWSGDIVSSWQDMYLSIPQMLSFNMFGISLFGADICGFGQDTTPELCIRWMQLGAFYPFMRNHNTWGAKDQDPGSFEKSVQKNMLKSLRLRYSLLPTLYSLMIKSSLHGIPVVRPLVFEFPNDSNTFAIDKQFMWGSHLLISPVLEEGAVKVMAYFPKSHWYDFPSGKKILAFGEWISLDAPLDVIPVAIQAHTIIFTLPPDTTTVKSRSHPFILIAALCPMGKAVGRLYWDDGLSRDSISTQKYNLVDFHIQNSSLSSSVINAGYEAENDMELSLIRVFGISLRPSTVMLNNVIIPFDYYDQVLELVHFPHVTLLSPINVVWF